MITEARAVHASEVGCRLTWFIVLCAMIMKPALYSSVKYLTHVPNGATYTFVIFVISLRSSLTQSTVTINIVHRAPRLARIQNERLMQRRLRSISSPAYSVSEIVV